MDLQGMDSMDFPLFGGRADELDLSSSFADFGSYNSSVADLSTVSPQDLTLSLSAPNSTAFTNLTSPSMYEPSPALGDFDFSPASGLEDTSKWPSLFPDAEQQMAQPVAPQPVPQQSIEQPSGPVVLSSPEDVHNVLAARRKSSATPARGSPKGTSPRGRHSSVNGVSSRKRDKPLPPIVVEDPNDTTGMKRARNTLAARKSRERKVAYIESLQSEVSAKDEEIEKLKAMLAEKDAKIAQLETENGLWKALPVA
ncbi:hypothetical protein DL546_006886 [Coniochaeta pulveracea]|uniref:BZIP domain-containing protein n=1 Tax=Coniochaeta pulveracea TaxID=177199 RepID=A0A420YAE7_9PEZI|nr:hypothetical protein DL546_006886 [Coniochaeta pulveracea]